MKNWLRFVFPILIILFSFIKVSNISPVLASNCTPPVSPTNFSAITGPGPGQVTLYWNQSPGANRYAVAYGTQSGQYSYGADHVGEEASRSYTVSFLSPGTPYYFALSAANQSCASGFSQEAMAVSQAGMVNSGWTSSMISSSLQAQPGANSGDVNLSWNNLMDATNFHLVYGTTREVNQYGALNIGKQTHFTVSKLRPGEKYYFSIIPVRNDQSLTSLGPVSSISTPLGQEVSVNSVETKIKVNSKAIIQKMQPLTTPSPTMMIKELPKSTPTPGIVIKSTLTPLQSPNSPQVSSGPSYFVP